MKLKYCSLFLVLILVFNLCIPCFNVYGVEEEGEENPSSTQADFINFYASSSEVELSMQNLTTQDYYVMFAFMSNFFEPGVTTLSDFTNSESVFYKNFAGGIGKDVSDSYLSGILESFQNDTITGLESGICTLLDSSGKPITGQKFLQIMMDSVSLGETFNVNTSKEVEDFDLEGVTNNGDVHEYSANSILKSKKVFFGDTTHTAFDFSSPATRAAFQVICAYNSKLFLSSEGIETLDRMFIDAVGNVWGIQIKNQEVLNTLNSNSGMKLNGLVSASKESPDAVLGSNVYLILPACLNPSTFSPQITETDKLRMPLMNRFTLGCLIGGDEIDSNFKTELVPFYNILNYDTFSNFKTSLAILGVNSLSPYLGNLGGYTKTSKGVWNSANWSTKYQDLANFIYDPALISLDESVKNGIGQFGTRSYIVFAPNPNSLQGSNNYTGTNSLQDLQEFWNGKAYTVGGKDFKNFTNGAKDIQRLISYLYTANFLNLNQVSMNFFSDLGSYADSSNPSGQITDKIVNDADNTLLGRNSLNLFFTTFSDSVDLETSDGSHKYKGFLMEDYNNSYLIDNLQKKCDFISSITVEDYNDIKNNKFDITKFLNSNDLDAAYSKLLQDIINNDKITDTGYLSEIFGDTVITAGSSGKYFKINLLPKGFLTIGNQATGSTTASNIAISNTVSLNDYGLSQILGFYGYLDKHGDEFSAAYLIADSKSALGYLLGAYGYTVFTPNDISEYRNKIGGTYGKSFKLLGSEEDFTVNISTATFENNQGLTMGVYFGYIVDMLGISIDGETDEKAGSLSCFGFNSVFLPKYSISAKGGELSFGGDSFGSGLLVDENTSFEEMQKDLIRRIYGLTTDDTNEYRNNLIKNILEGFVLTIHRTITGTWFSDISTVTTGSNSTYTSVAGYIYTPTLEELSFTATLMNNYLKVYIFCMMVIIFLLILMTLLNMRTWQQSLIIGTFMFLALLFPYILISNTINISNSVSDSIYSDRFDFWAITEHQQSKNSLGNLDGLSEKNMFLKLSSATADSTYNGGTGVKIKWMSPKKVDMFQSLYSDKSLSESFVTNIQIFKWLFNSFIYDSEFVDTEAYGSYVYRSYKNLALEAESYYEWGKNLTNSSSFNNMNNNSDIIEKVEIGKSIGVSSINIPKMVEDSLKEYTINSVRGDLSSYLGLFSRYDENFIKQNTLGLTYSDEMMQDLKKIKVQGFSENSSKIALWGLVNPDITKRIVEKENENTVGIVSNLPSSSGDSKAFDNASEVSIAKAIFLKNTESPYYYFYSVLKEQYKNIGTSSSFKKALLTPNSFKLTLEDMEDISVNNKGRLSVGLYKDFLDLEGLFSVIIPYLNDSNMYVQDWRKTYGGNIEEYNFEYSVDDSGFVDETDEKYQAALEREQDKKVLYQEQVTKKNNLNKVWNMYSPWVDSLYDLDILNKKVAVGGKKTTIENTLNPSSYIKEGRPMIFSEVDMELRGYSYKDLTDIERRIQAVTEKTYKDLMFLVNYYDMDDDVLLSAAAMYATFNFNSEFTKKSFLGTDVVLYPQGFELKNFNYDAFMRLALLNSTGETVFANEDLYERVLAKTSIFTGLLLIVCDLVACIGIPMFKFVILIGLLFLGILICIACVVNPPEKIFEAVCKSLLLPTILFMALNIAFAWVMSLIVGEGLTAYVGSKTVNFATNDPTITMLIMALLGVVYLFCAWKILKFLIAAYKQFGMGTALAAVGIVGAAIAAGTAGVAKKATKIAGRGIGMGIGAATAEKGNRLSGAMEGAGAGTKGIVGRRLQEKRMVKALSGGLSGNKQTTNKINDLASSSGSGPNTSGSNSGKSSSPTPSGKAPTQKEESKTPPSELDRSMENVTDKKANKLGKALGGLSYTKAKVADKFDAVKSGFKNTGYVVSNLPEVARYGKDKASARVTSKIDKASSYMGSALRTYRDENDFNKYRNSERSKERAERRQTFEQKVSSKATIDRNIKMMNKKRQVG